MGTHPIFESDFDCLTDNQKSVKMTTEEVTTEKPAQPPVETKQPPVETKQEATDGAKVESDKKDNEKKPRNKNRRVNQIKKDGGGYADGSNRQPRKRVDTWNARDLKIIRALSGILGHGMYGFVPDEQGFLFLEDILEHKHFKDQLNVKLDDLKRICNDKKGNKQFELATEEKDGKNLLKVKKRSHISDEEITVKK